MTPDCYGGIIFDDEGRVLVRKPSGGWGGYAWTFAKGSPEKGEKPEETALREVFEETGWRCEIVAAVPGAFESDTCWTRYFVMRPVGSAGRFDEETEEVRWVSIEEARVLLSQSLTVKGRVRDMAALAAAELVLRERTVFELPIREMGASDVGRCIWVRTQTRENCWTTEGLERVGITEASVVARLGATHRGWVCEDNGEIVGFSMCDYSNGEFLVVAVLPECEGRGIGRRLVEAGQRWLHEKGWEKIWLWTSVDVKTRAYRLYRKMGWGDCGIKDGQLVMRHR